MPRAVYSDELHSPPTTTAHQLLYAAVRIADAFPATQPPPTVKQLMSRFGMHRSTAYRWRAAFCAARGVDSSGGRQ